MGKKKIILTVLIILVSTLLFAIAMWLLSDSIADWAVNGNPFFVTIVNIVTNPFYIGSVVLILFIFMHTLKIDKTFVNYVRVTLASIFFNLAIDIMSILHAYNLNFTIGDPSAVSLYFDYVIGKPLKLLFVNAPYVGTFILYVLIPMLMILLSVFVASPKEFIKMFRSEFA